MKNDVMTLEAPPIADDLEIEAEAEGVDDGALPDLDDDEDQLAFDPPEAPEEGLDDDGAGDEDADDLVVLDAAVEEAGKASAAGPAWIKVSRSFVEACETALPPCHALQTIRTCVGYTRESTDRQTKTSKPRQVAAINAYVKVARLKLRTIFSDEGVTGTSTYDRHEWHHMMDAARAKEFKVIVVEHLDRFGRSLPDVLRAWEELTELGIEIHDTKHGRLDLAHIVIMGYLGVDGRLRFLDLCKGGKRRAVAAGLVMQAPSYGYRRHRGRRPGVHEIVPERARNVVKIMKWAAAGIGSKRIATEMNRRGFHSPRQCHLLDTGEAPDEVARPWSAQEIRAILRNPLYSGWNVWGRSKTRRHRDTKRLEGRDRRAPDEWVIAPATRLRIVPEALQASAIRSLASRTFGGASSANRAGTRLLAGCVHCAACGSPMHARTVNSHAVYHCSDHVSQALDRCPVKATVQIEWVERAVVATVEARLRAAADDQAYRARFQTAFAAASEGRLRRIGELGRAIGRINADLKASHIAASRNIGVDDELIAEINKGLRDRREQLAKIRTGLEDVAPPAEAYRQLDALNAGFARLAAALPFRAVEPEGEVLAQRFRKLVGRIDVHPRDGEGVVRLVLTYDRDRLTRPLHYKVELDAKARTTTICIDTVAERRRDLGARQAEAYAETLEAAQTGLHRIDDAAFEAAQALAADVDLVVDGARVDLRTLLDGVFCVLKTGGALSKPPACYGDAGVFHKALRRLVRANAWDAIVAAYATVAPGVLAGADLKRVNASVYPRGSTRDRTEVRPRKPKDAAARIERLRAAAGAEGDATTKRRLEAVAMRLEGRPAAEVAAAVGRSVATIYALGCRYRDGDVEALRGARSSARTPAARRDRHIPFTAEQDADIAAMARRGVDRQGSPLKFATLSQMCRDELGIPAGKWALRAALARQGLDLYAIVAPARAAAQKAGEEAARARRRAETAEGPRPVRKRVVDPRPRRGGHLLSRRLGIDIGAAAP